MNGVVTAAAAAVVASALVAAFLVLTDTRRLDVALAVFLDLVLAAGLLLLTLRPSPRQLAGVAGLILVKQVATSGVAISVVSRRVDDPPPAARD